MKSFSKMAVKLLCVLLCLGMVSFPAFAENESLPETVSSGYEKTAENEKNTLFVNGDNGQFILKNNATGKLWYSIPSDVEKDEITAGTKFATVKSAISVGYIERSVEAGTQALSYANSSVYCPDGNVKVEKIKNGVKVAFEFEDYGFVIPVTYTLKNDYLEISLLVDEIKESREYFIVSINLFPTFGAGNSTANGKLFIPDGSGAFVNFNNNIVSIADYILPVYGEDITLNKDSTLTKKQSVKMPVFATLTGGNSLAGIITEGDANSSITFINGNEQCGYNAVSTVFNYREMMNKEVFGGTGSASMLNRVSRITSLSKKYTVRYYPLGTESIFNVADIYRDYLVKEQKLKAKISDSMLHIDLYGAMDIKSSFLGIPYRKTVALTKYDKAYELLKELKNSGADSLSVRYIGWNNSGILNMKITDSAKPLKKLGSKSEFNKLIDFANENDITLYLDNDLLRFRKNGNGVTKSKSAVKSVFGEKISTQENMLSWCEPKSGQLPVYYLKSSLLKKVFEDFMKSFTKQKYNTKNIGLSVMANTLYSDLNAKDGAMREVLLNEYKNIYYALSRKGYNIVSDSANAYAIPYSSMLLDVPTASSKYDVYDEEIPFYEIVLHGKIGMATGSVMQSDVPEKQFLKSVELGTAVCFSGIDTDSSVLNGTVYDGIYSSTFDIWKDTALKQYQKYNKLYKKIKDQAITDYFDFGNGVVKTMYANGISVYVNYNGYDMTVDGLTISKMDFALKETL